MKCKKLLALVLAVLMIVSLFAACDTDKPQPTNPPATQGGNDPKPTDPPATNPPTEDKTIEFPLAEPLDVSVMMVMGNSSYSYNDNIAWKFLQERANINFQVTEFPSSEAKEKMNLLMNGGEYTDVLFKANKIDLDKYGMDGILIPLEDLIREYCPNLTALLDERNAWNTIAAPDGHIYSLPLFQHPVQYGSGGSAYFINQKWLEAVGKEMPTTQEEFYEALKAMKEGDPNGNGKADEIPFAPDIAHTHKALSDLIGYFGEGLSYGDYWMEIDGQMEYLPTTEYFKENVLKYFHKLYSEGLMAEDAFTLTREQYRAICGAEEVVYGMVYDSSVGYFGDANERYNWASLKPFDPAMYSVDNGVQTGGFAITDKCENPEIMMAWGDYLYSDEGGRVIRLGIEDVSYKINADGSFESITEGFESNTYQATLMGSATVPGVIPDIYYQKPSADANKHLNKELYGEGYGVWNVGTLCPTLVYTEEEDAEYSVISTDINSYVQNYVAECTTGIVDIDATWEAFQKTLKEMKVDGLNETQRDDHARANGK